MGEEVQMVGAAGVFQPEDDGLAGAAHSSMRLAPFLFSLSRRSPPDQTSGTGSEAGAPHALLVEADLLPALRPLEFFEVFPPLLSLELLELLTFIFVASSTPHSGSFSPSSAGVLQLFCLEAVQDRRKHHRYEVQDLDK
jgi:hypothetical protein